MKSLLLHEHLRFSIRKLIFYPSLFLLANCLPAIAQQSILQTPFTLQLGEVTITQALAAIETNSGYTFSYSSNLIDTKRKVHISYTNTTLARILQDLLGEEARSISVAGKQINIQPSAGRGSIAGTVKTSDGQPAAYVTVSVKGQRSTQADAQGHYTLPAIEVGQHTVTASFLGLQTQKKEVNILDKQTTTLHFVLLEDAQTLQEVIVNSERTSASIHKETAYVARMPLKNLENPQVYSVVPKELMQQQVAVSISQVVRNATGAVPTEFDSGGLGILTRGFTTGVNARNGMETATNRTSIDIANIERLEVLKGPSGTLFGSTISSYGGVVNVVTKKPFDQHRSEVAYTAGSYGLSRLSIDVNAPLKTDKSVLFRLNSALTREKSFLNAGFNRSIFVAPSLYYHANERLDFHLDAEILAVNKTQPWYTLASPNAGFRNPGDIPLPYKGNLLMESADAKNTATKIFAEAKYKLSENWTSSTLLSYTGEDIHHSYQLFTRWPSADQMIRMVTRYGPINQNYLAIQENINGSFQTGFMRHKLLIGANYRFYSSNYSASSGTIDTVLNIQDYRPLGRSVIDDKLTESSSLIPDQQTWSAYVSDAIQFTDRLSTLLSLRVDYFNRSSAGTTPDYQQTSLAPKLGLVYQAVKDQVSIFGNYMSGFQNQAPYDQPDGSRLVLDPTFANQSEAGLKAEMFNKKVDLTASYYYIAIDNAISYVDGYAIQNGKQVSKGLEFELNARPIRGLQFLAGYVYNDNKITENADRDLAGKTAVNAPKHVANAWIAYTFSNTLRGLGLGFGANYVASSYLFSDNNYHIPQYTIYQATVFYDQSTWRLGLKMNNLGNTSYWGPWGMPQAPRNFAANLTIRF